MTKNDSDFILNNTTSFNECTGLIPANIWNGTEYDVYSEIFDFIGNGDAYEDKPLCEGRTIRKKRPLQK